MWINGRHFSFFSRRMYLVLFLTYPTFSSLVGLFPFFSSLSLCSLFLQSTFRLLSFLCLLVLTDKVYIDLRKYFNSSNKSVRLDSICPNCCDDNNRKKCIVTSRDRTQITTRKNTFFFSFLESARAGLYSMIEDNKQIA